MRPQDHEHAVDLVVVGLGAIGAFALRAALERGLSVCGLEQYEPAHQRGATGGLTRIFRMHYREGPAYRPLLEESRAEWERLDAVAPGTAWYPCGALTFGPADDPGLRALRKQAAASGLPAEVLGAEEAAARWPQLRFDDADVALLDPLGGLVDVAVALGEVFAQARSAGAVLRFGTRVAEAVERADGLVEVRTDAGERVVARAVLWATGSWGLGLAPALQGMAWREPVTVHWFTPHRAGAFGPDVLPVGQRVGRGPAELSFFPQVDARGMKTNFYLPAAVSPQAEPAPPQPEVDAVVLRHLDEVYAGLDPASHTSAVCLEVFTQDGRLLVDRVPGAARQLFAVGGSGHAFKMAPALGRRIVARLLDDVGLGGAGAGGAADPVLARLPDAALAAGAR